MHVRVRLLGKAETIVVVESKLTKIEKFRRILKEKFDVQPKLQRLLYGGKLLEDGYTFHDYNIKLNDVIQLMVRMQTDESSKQDNKENHSNGDVEKKNEDTKIEYEDAESVLYTTGDLIDMKDRAQGAWFEGKIVQIVHDPDAPSIPDANGSRDMRSHSDDEDAKQFFDSENDVENKPPEAFNGENSNPKKGIAKYFHKSLRAKPKGKRKLSEKESPKVEKNKEADVNLLYKVQLDGEEEDSVQYCKINEIRPRARTVIDASDLKVGQEIMLNYNTDYPREKGNWYDFKISEIIKKRKTYELVGTLYLGPQAVPQNDITVKVHDKIFAREEVVPLAKRTMEHQKTMTTKPESRTRPLNCITCRDNKAAPCKDCGCFLCSSKEFPEKIILCDECDKGYHMNCLTPPLTDLPEGDWYCPSCKRDPNDVIAPGAAKQMKKAPSKGNRDWGRGMACAGKTKTCSMPANHFGPIPGIEVGMCWRFRIQLSESGVHRPPVSGIHGRDVEGAYSIVLSGGYEDDVDYGYEFTYTGSGGRNLSGNKRTAEQSCDQTLTRENKALARNCAVKQISEEGGDAGDSWRSGKPVRVVRSYKMLKHFPKYAPKEGIRYDGIYKVVKYYPEKGLSGYRVWKYLLRRDDPEAAPWEPPAKEFPIIYPDGYLEAQAEKMALKDKTKKVPKGGKKRALRDSNAEASPPDSADAVGEPSAPFKRQKAKSVPKEGKLLKSGLSTCVDAAGDEGTAENQSPDKYVTSLTDEEKKFINADTVNAKLWADCLKVCGRLGKKGFIEHVTQEFLCIICQDVTAGPVTTPCLHNFCMGCLKQALRRGPTCPCCRASLARFDPEPNEQLQAALRIILPGYDAGRTALSTL